MLLTNGRIYTLDAGDRVVDTLVVRAGRVVFAGRRADVSIPAGERVIERGKGADLVVCSADVFTCPAAEIPGIEPVLTVVAGEIVLDRGIAS